LPTAVSADLLKPPRFVIGFSIVTLALAAAISIGWAAITKLDEVSTGEGRVIPAGRLKVVQSLEGGIVRDIFVKEGGKVIEGETLLLIDPTGFVASLGEQKEKIAGLEALAARLRAEVRGTALAFPDAVLKAQPDLAANETRLYKSRQQELASALSALAKVAEQKQQEAAETEARIANLQAALKLAESERGIVEPMVRRNVAPRIELVRLETRINEVRGQLDAATLSLPRIKAAIAEAKDRRLEKESNFEGEAMAKLSATEVELSALREAAKGNADKVRRADIRAPVSGIVKTVYATTIGEVLKPGANIVEIVPAEDSLLVEAKVKPQDIAFLHPGLEANVKLTAYDSAIYGGLKGKLEQISADSIQTEKGETYFLVRVRTNANHLVKNGHQLPIMPGMVATVEIKTGAKSVLEYIAKPITRLAHQSLRER
jgi:membrane fusion protein, adhesin transport system